jgi:hypothetical protein
MKKSITTLLLFSAIFTQAQVGIGVATANIDASAQLEVKSTTKGFLPPRMLASEKAAIATPAAGLLVYQTDAPVGLYYYTGSAWTIVNSAATGSNFVDLTTAQNIAGAKTFSNAVSGNNTSGATLAGFSANMNTQTGTTYTLSTSDNGKIITLNNASAITLTVPALFAGFNCMIVQLGSGQVTLQAGSLVTISNRSSNTKTAGANAIATILGLTSTTFISSGDMSN